MFYNADITEDIDDIFDVEKPDIVIHLAAQVMLRKSLEDPIYDAKTNIIGTLSVLEACRRNNVKRVIYTSTGGARVGEPKYLPVDETDIDALAVAIGNSHGKYKGKPNLDFERLANINKILGIPLVLHGGSGISDTDFKRAIDLGISKINFFTGMSQSALQAAKDFFRASLENYNDYLNMNLKIKDSVRKTVKEQMRIFGSINKAKQ